MYKSMSIGLVFLACITAQCASACTISASNVLKAYKVDIVDLQRLSLPQLELRFQLSKIADQGNGFPKTAGFKTTGEWQDISVLEHGVIDLNISSLDPDTETQVGWSRRCPEGEKVTIAFTLDPASKTITRDMIDIALLDYKTLKSNASFLVRRFMPKLKRATLISSSNAPLHCKVLLNENSENNDLTSEDWSVQIDEFQDMLCTSDKVLVLLSD